MDYHFKNIPNMHNNNKKKLSANDMNKIAVRYSTKLEEFKNKTLDELQDIYMNGKKLSSTDMEALLAATDSLLKQKAVEIARDFDFKERKKLLESNG